MIEDWLPEYKLNFYRYQEESGNEEEKPGNRHYKPENSLGSGSSV
jgi:hypothetical protein